MKWNQSWSCFERINLLTDDGLRPHLRMSSAAGRNAVIHSCVSLALDAYGQHKYW
jgi:hypothetical protein